MKKSHTSLKWFEHLQNVVSGNEHNSLLVFTYCLHVSLFQLDGRVKTLHPSIHGGILARRDQEHHLKALKDHGIGEFIIPPFNIAYEF